MGKTAYIWPEPHACFSNILKISVAVSEQEVSVSIAKRVIINCIICKGAKPDER